MSNSQLHQLSGVSKALISQLENGNRPFTQKTLEDLAEALGCSIYDFFRTDAADPAPTPPPTKVAGEIWPNDLRLLAEWVMEQEEPARLAANIRFMVETRYPEFEAWIKKREGERARGAAPESQSAGGG